MKKVINILVSIIFLVSFIGVNIHKHYSQGKLYSTAIFQEADTCCEDMELCEMANTSETCEQNQENDCSCSCENKIEIFKISDYFVNEKFSIATKKIIDLYFVSVFQKIETTRLLSSYNKTSLFPSPPLNKTDVQSEFCVFLI